MKLYLKLIVGLFLTFTLPVFADLNVFTCEPEWSSLVKEIAGDKVNTFSATTGLQDPHTVLARPSLIARVRKVDLIICTGADLEIGWLPLLIRRANNPKIQPGKPGNLIATHYARLLGRPKSIDRSQGDIHSAGNPHIQTNPKNILPVAKAIAARMMLLDPANTKFYQDGLADFTKRWKVALKKWKKMTKPLRKIPIVVHHLSWNYLVDYLSLNQVAVLEDKPGIPPTSGHLSKLLNKMKKHPAKMIIVAAYLDQRPAKWLSEKTSIPAVKLPFTLGGTEAAKDLFSLYDDTFTRMLEVLEP